MKFMLLIYSDEKVWTEPEAQQCFEDSTRLAHSLNAEGKYRGASPLQPVATAASLRIRDGKRIVTDGPFAETYEQLGGYFLVEAADIEEAIEIAARVPGVHKGTVEVRPILELPNLPDQ